ncbi:MAG: L,D-transpeptidase [Verrucomicrobiaceae bacterium]
MKSLASLLALALGALALSSCSDVSTSTSVTSYSAFKAKSDYRQSSKVYRNRAVYDAAVHGNTEIRIDLSDQRAQLLVGPEKQVAIDTPVCTGKAGKRTPPGRYRVQEKIVDKRSNIFGTTYYKGRRVHGGDRRKYKGRRDKYVGASLPYWMRMTGGGIGMHGSGYVHRYPGSNGCVRTPHDVIDDIYRKIAKGSPIVVVQ